MNTTLATKSETIDFGFNNDWLAAQQTQAAGQRKQFIDSITARANQAQAAWLADYKADAQKKRLQKEEAFSGAIAFFDARDNLYEAFDGDQLAIGKYQFRSDISEEQQEQLAYMYAQSANRFGQILAQGYETQRFNAGQYNGAQIVDDGHGNSNIVISFNDGTPQEFTRTFNLDQIRAILHKNGVVTSAETKRAQTTADTLKGAEEQELSLLKTLTSMSSPAAARAYIEKNKGNNPFLAQFAEKYSDVLASEESYQQTRRDSQQGKSNGNGSSKDKGGDKKEYLTREQIIALQRAGLMKQVDEYKKMRDASEDENVKAALTARMGQITAAILALDGGGGDASITANAEDKVDMGAGGGGDASSNDSARLSEEEAKYKAAHYMKAHGLDRSRWYDDEDLHWDKKKEKYVPNHRAGGWDIRNAKDAIGRTYANEDGTYSFSIKPWIDEEQIDPDTGKRTYIWRDSNPSNHERRGSMTAIEILARMGIKPTSKGMRYSKMDKKEHETYEYTLTKDQKKDFDFYVNNYVMPPTLKEQKAAADAKAKEEQAAADAKAKEEQAAADAKAKEEQAAADAKAKLEAEADAKLKQIQRAAAEKDANAELRRQVASSRLNAQSEALAKDAPKRTVARPGINSTIGGNPYAPQYDEKGRRIGLLSREAVAEGKQGLANIRTREEREAKEAAARQAKEKEEAKKRAAAQKTIDDSIDRLVKYYDKIDNLGTLSEDQWRDHNDKIGRVASMLAGRKRGFTENLLKQLRESKDWKKRRIAEDIEERWRVDDKISTWESGGLNKKQ